MELGISEFVVCRRWLGSGGLLFVYDSSTISISLIVKNTHGK